VTVVPQANPLGIGQFRQGRILGRYHDATGHNFNRGFDQSAAMERSMSNVQQWQKKLVQLAAPADVMLDLHTDDEALPYLYVHRRFWPRGRALAAAMKMDVAIIWDEGGDGSFEETIIAPWLSEQDRPAHGRDPGVARAGRCQRSIRRAGCRGPVYVAVRLRGDR
jgi:predicted deacylase